MSELVKAAAVLAVVCITVISGTVILTTLGPPQTIKPTAVFALSVAMIGMAAVLLKLFHLVIKQWLPEKKSAAEI